MTFQAISTIASTFGSLHTDSVAPSVPWGLNPVAVEAIASSVSAVITASALIIAVRTYFYNSRAAARSQAALVGALGTIGDSQTIDGVECWPLEIRITNSSDADVFDLSLLLHSKHRGTHLDDIRLGFVRSYMSESLWVPLWRTRAQWILKDATVVPPGVSTLRVYLDYDQLFASRVGVGFSDRNGRKWTRWLDGELVESWKI